MEKTTELKIRHRTGADFVSTALKSTEHTSISAILIFSIFTLQRWLPLRTSCSSSLAAPLKKTSNKKPHTYFRYIFYTNTSFWL